MVEVVAALFALALWWLSTGLVLLAVRRYSEALPTLLGWATVLWAAGLAGLYFTRDDQTVLGAYVAFASALALWAWHEISFLTGLVTGPRQAPAQRTEAQQRAPLRSAIETLLYHELAIFGSFAMLLVASGSGANRFGLITFLVLWVMRLSAKFNLYLGVPNLGESFLPRHLAYLQTYFCRRPMNYLFPVSVTAATLLTYHLGAQALSAEADPHTATGYMLVTTLLVLAVVEHWFMVLPFEATALWNWGLDHHAKPEPHISSTPLVPRSPGHRNDDACPATALAKGTP